MTNNSTCPFCSPNIDQRVIYKDELSLLVLSRDAINAGQALVVPKRHIKTVNEASEEEICSMHNLAKKVADAFVSELHYDGVNILINSGNAAGQTVDHLHIHVVPRRVGDVKIARDWLSLEYKENEYCPGKDEIIYYSTKLKSFIGKP